jgi:hypothetical protein
MKLTMSRWIATVCFFAASALLVAGFSVPAQGSCGSSTVPCLTACTGSIPVLTGCSQCIGGPAIGGLSGTNWAARTACGVLFTGTIYLFWCNCTTISTWPCGGAGAASPC